tara:strand:+ start:2147 stop:3016 length:870 start_codon:yes stop_codon:yes gene_type:complete
METPYVMSKENLQSQDKYLGGHPLDGNFILKQEWVTPVGQIELNLPEAMRIGLIEYIASKGYCTTMGTHKRTMTTEFERNHYNLFDDSENNPHIKGYEEISSEIIRYFVAKAYNIENADQLDIECRGFGNMQTTGRRTYPHYHHAFDGVMITYLTLGGEFTLTSDVGGEDDLQLVAPNSTICELKEKISVQEKSGTVANYADFDLKKEDMPCESDGGLLLLDPRPAINYPYNTKAKNYVPKIGTTVIHPAYIWHESNTFVGQGIRACVVINYRVNTYNNNGLVRPMIKK